jgi:signal transduction histidine kinase
MRERADAAERRVREYAALLDAVTEELKRDLTELRLPLHILLDNRFGDLNENQEEMLAAARAAAEQADRRLTRLREIVDLDRGAVALRRDAVPAGELIASLLPGLNADGEQAGVRVSTDLAPALPRVVGDRARLQQACGLLLAQHVRSMPSGSNVEISASADGSAVQIDVTPGGSLGVVTGAVTGADDALARRVIVASGGTVTESADRTTITLPIRPPGASPTTPSSTPAAPDVPSPRGP